VTTAIPASAARWRIRSVIMRPMPLASIEGIAQVGASRGYAADFFGQYRHSAAQRRIVEPLVVVGLGVQVTESSPAPTPKTKHHRMDTEKLPAP
jgi:hypothetical protein